MPTKITGGRGSVAQGSGIASEVYSHSEGNTTVASGSYSHAEGNATTASGGGGSHAEGWSSIASGVASHAEGRSTQATNDQAHAEGYLAVATGTYSHAEGVSTTASGSGSHAEGSSSTASGTAAHAEGYAVAAGAYSHGEGYRANATRFCQHSKGGVPFAVEGDAQANRFLAAKATTDATVTTLTFDSAGSVSLTGVNTNVLTIPVNRAHQFRVSVVARRSDVSGDVAGWVLQGLVGRGSSGDAAFVGTVAAQAWGSAGAAAWDVTLTVDTSNGTNNYLKIAVTGEAAKTIRWVATVETTEVG